MKAKLLIEQAVLQEQLYKLSSTQINLPAAHADYVLKWGREMIPDEQLYYDEKGGLGRETEIHVTVLYGLTDKVPSKELLELIKRTPPFTARLTAVTLFDNNPDYDVVKFDVESEELVALSKAVRLACPNENKYPDYHPHCTVAYVKKGRALDVAGNYPFEQNPPIPAEFEVNEIIFKPAGESGDPNRKPIHLPLNRYRKEAEDPKHFLKRVAGKTDLTCMLCGQPTRTYLTRYGKKLCVCNPCYLNTPRAAEEIERRYKLREAETPKEVLKKAKEAKSRKENGGVQVLPPIKARLLPARPVRQMGEAESPKAAMKLKRITTSLMFWQVPDGFYFRTVNYPLVKKLEDPEIGSNAVTTDLDTVRQITFQPRTWVFPPDWTINDITTGHRLESLVEAPRPAPVPDIYESLDEVESPKGFIKDQAPRFVIYSKDSAGCWFFRREQRGEWETFTWVQKPEGATQFVREEDAEAMLKNHGLEWHLPPARVGPINQDWSQVVEAEDPKGVLRAAIAAATEWYIARSRDSYGHGLSHSHYMQRMRSGPTWTPWIHNASVFRSEEEARAAFLEYFEEGEIKAWGVEFEPHTWRTAPVREAEDPKNFLKRTAPRPPDFTFTDHGSIILCYPKDEATMEWLKSVLDDEAQFYASSLVIEPRYLRDFVQALHDDGWTTNLKLRESVNEAEDPKSVFRQMVDNPHGPCLIKGRWKGAPDDSAWSYWGDFPEGWGWTPVMRHATVVRPENLRHTLERIRATSQEDYNLVTVPFDPALGEAREPGPFDLLQFPTDASVLAAKLLELDHVEKPTVL